jgi:hypothetical protein
VHAARLGFAHQSEVKELDAAVVRHQHVRRLDVAVKNAPRVQDADAFRELRQRDAQPVDVASRSSGDRFRLRPFDKAEKVDAADQLHRENHSSSSQNSS